MLTHLSQENLERVETVHGTFWSQRADMITEQLRTYSAHTRNELSMVLSFLRENDVVFDIGAHIGTFTVPMARGVGPSGKVIAFEADEENFELLQENVSLNGLGSTVDLHHLVVFDRPDRFQCLQPDPGNASHRIFLPIEGNEPIAREDVCQIDDFVRRGLIPNHVDLMKVDVEGADVHVLRSCRELIATSLPIIYCEVNSRVLSRFQHTLHDLAEELLGYGYHLFANASVRNSNQDQYRIARLNQLDQGGAFFDVLAIHPESGRYPGSYLSARCYRIIKTWQSLEKYVRRKIGVRR